MSEKQHLIYSYVRVSTRKQLGGYSIEAQEEMIQNWVAYEEKQGKLDRPLLRMYQEKGKSGKQVKLRPKFAQLQLDIGKQKPDFVVVAKLDRWGRNRLEVVSNIKDLNSQGINFVSLDFNIDTSTPTGMFVLTVMSALAEMDREMIIERTRIGRERARANGVIFGRPKIKIDKHLLIKDLNKGLTPVDIAVERKVGVKTIRRRIAEWKLKPHYKETPIY
ncbi:MAG: recombinase family protein [Candidatus Heimdallarchaeota archaeon]|nr:recombinase family protein [Candidatus Heimdallarchaeota archaeon]